MWKNCFDAHPIQLVGWQKFKVLFATNELNSMIKPVYKVAEIIPQISQIPHESMNQSV